MTKEVRELLKNKEFEKVKKIVEEKSKKELDILYSHSPLNKTPETELFERIVHQLIQDYDKGYATRKINFYKDSDQNTIIILDTNLITSKEFQEIQEKFTKFYEKPIDLEKINLRDLLEKANLNHLNLDNADIQKYADLFTSVYRENQGPPISTLKRKIPELEYGEVLAINRYTYKGDYYMNTLLRDANALGIYSTPMAILDSAIAAHGLNKLPDITLPHVIRYQGKDTLSILLKNVEQGKITQEKGFISTSLNNLNPINSYNSVRIIFNDIRGKYITPISQFQYYFNKEEEYLIPPSTQVEWTGYSKEKNKNGEDLHIVTAKGSNVLIDQFKERNQITEKDEYITQIQDFTPTIMLSLFNEDELEKLPFTLITALVDKSDRSESFRYYPILLKGLADEGFPVYKLTKLPVEEAMFFINNACKICEYSHDYKFSASTLTEMPFENAKYFLENFVSLNELNRIKFPILELIEMPFEDAKYFLENARDIKKMSENKILKISSSFSPETIIALKKQVEEYKEIHHITKHANIVESKEQLSPDKVNLSKKSSNKGGSIVQYSKLS